MKRFLLLVALSVAGFSHGVACGPFDRYNLATDYYLFRACGEDMEGKGWSLAKERGKANCKAWADLTSESIPLADIHEVVYEWDMEALDKMQHEIASSKSAKSSNRFAQWIVRHKDKETVDFLMVAKNCEKIRAQQNTLWYYPVEGDDYSIDLEKVIEKAESYQGKRLRDRYDLQAIRALFAQQQYGECINYWLQNQGNFSKGVIKDMAVGYIAGSYIRLKQIDKAEKLYLQNGDPHAAVVCGSKKGDRFDKVYGRNPNDGWLIAEIQRRIHTLESYTNQWFPESDWDREKFQEINAKVVKICKEKLCKDMAPWYYARAYLADRFNREDEAWTYILKAEQVAKDKDLLDAVHVLKILIRSRKINHYNLDFENDLFKELKWLDQMIVDNMEKDASDRIMNQGVSNHICGFSQYYWSDMMRRILIGNVVPLCIRSGYEERALTYLNYADNRIFNLVGTIVDGHWEPASSEDEYGTYVTDSISWKQYRSRQNAYNEYDYRNDFFINLDSLGVEHVQRLATRLEHPKSELDRFLVKRSYVDLQYLYDIIGTQLMAAMKYGEAVQYLSKVSADFNRSRNVFEYCKVDPFTTKEMAQEDEFYKLNFAKKMVSLEQRIAATDDVNEKAELILTYARGLHSSIGDEGWLLTSFYWGYFDSYSFHSTYQVNMANKIAKRSMALIEEALQMFTDRSRAAQAYYDWKRFKSAATKFPETDVAHFIVGHCDRLCDYVIRPSLW